MTTLPPKLKSLNSYLKLANELEKRDPVVAYYCRLYAVQKGMELDNSTDGKKFLMTLLDLLEKSKTTLKNEEAMISETVGQAYIEQYALKLFSHADKKDREADFSQATIRTFATSGFLMDVLSVFGEVPEDVEKCRKYAKWKAVYISQCLKKGETPHSGPLDDSEEISNALGTSNDFVPGGTNNLPPSQPVAAPRGKATANIPDNSANTLNPPSEGPGNLSASQFAQAEKFCKYALSSLQYQDCDTAISYLNKCLDILQKK